MENNNFLLLFHNFLYDKVSQTPLRGSEHFKHLVKWWKLKEILILSDELPLCVCVCSENLTRKSNKKTATKWLLLRNIVFSVWWKRHCDDDGDSFFYAPGRMRACYIDLVRIQIFADIKFSIMRESIFSFSEEKRLKSAQKENEQPNCHPKRKRVGKVLSFACMILELMKQEDYSKKGINILWTEIRLRCLAAFCGTTVLTSSKIISPNLWLFFIHLKKRSETVSFVSHFVK